MAVNNPSVSITKSTSVFPKLFLEPQKTLVLSNLDRQCPTLMYTVFFYGSSTGQQDLCFDSVFSRLKSSLEATLSAWYPAAGRLSFSRDGKLNLWCNNGGAVLVQAVARAKISELGDLSVYNHFFENLVFKPVIADGNITEMPLVVAQVTKFDCGGYSIGIGTSHSLFDGISAFDFLRAWASQSHDQPSHQLHKPVHERGSLLHLDNHKDNSSNSNNTIPTAIDNLFQLITQANLNQINQETNNLVFKTFHLTPAVIDKLKKKVLTEKKDKLCFSSFEVLAAHLWKARTRALGLSKDRKVCLQFAVDARNKTVPPLSKDFTGNAYVLASIVSTAGELEQHSYQHIINQIKKTKNNITHNYIMSYTKALQGPQPTNLPPLPELTVVSDWTRVPFHKVDFFGKEALYASPLVPPIPQVAYFMQNPNDSLAVDVRIGLLPRIQSAFSHYFMEII